MTDGLLTFAKYAFPPNYFNLCGPRNNSGLFELVNKNESGAELKNLLVQFEGAMPYLRLIAKSNGIKNEFDYRVVEAYWIGNNLLEKVEIKDIYSNIENRFRKKISSRDWSWLVSESIPRAKPFHGFHVFDIYRRAGLLRSGETKNILETMDKCRISWGRIESLLQIKKNNFNLALVNRAPLEFENKKLRLGEKKIEEFFIIKNEFRIGDDVSLHWNYICDKITPFQKKNLIYWTKYHLEITNKTI